LSQFFLTIQSWEPIQFHEPNDFVILRRNFAPDVLKTIYSFGFSILGMSWTLKPGEKSTKVLQALFNNKKYSDVTIVSSNKTFSAHLNILAMSSPVFERMMDSGMREATEKRIVIKTHAPEIVEKLLQFIYAKDIIVDGSSLMPLFAISHEYNVENLLAQCVQLLVEAVDESTCCDILISLDSCPGMDGDQKIKLQCLDMLINKYDTLYTTSGFDKLSFDFFTFSPLP